MVRRSIEAWNAFIPGDPSRQDMAGIAEEFFDPDIEYEWHGEQLLPDVPQQVHGIPAVAGIWEQLLGAYADLRLALLECIEAPDNRILAVVRQSGRGRESGIPIEAHMFQVTTIQDSVICRLQIFRHRAEALEAAGLSE